MSAPGEPASDPMLGQVVDGRYLIRGILGRGGMGVVYDAVATRLGGRPCAVKVLLPEFTRNDNAVARFSREAELAARVKHPNVVEIFDTGTTADGRGYIAMELLRGESLDRTLRREGPLSWSRAQHIIIQICRALAVAHAEKITHRDMKPENCFRGERDGDRDFIKVLDFGIAKLTEKPDDPGAARLTASDAVIGTYAYMAPEQARGESIDHRVDVWALGVMLYEMLTGHLPFRGNNQVQIWNAVCNYDPEVMRSIAPAMGIPEPAEAIVRRALTKARDSRFPTVDALARALAEVQVDSAAPLATARPGSLNSPPIDAASSTFVGGLTIAQEHQPANARTDPVSPHALTELSTDEVVETREHVRVMPPRPVPSPDRTVGAVEPRQVMKTAASDLPMEPEPARAVATPPTPRRSTRALGSLMGFGLATAALVLWLSQRTGEMPTSEPVADIASDEPTSRPAEVASLPPPSPVKSNTALAVVPDGVPAIAPAVAAAPAPDPPEAAVKAVATASKKPIERFAVRAARALQRLRVSPELAVCFAGYKQPLEVDVTIEVTTGAATVTVPPLKRKSALDTCIQRVFKGATFPRGGPGESDFVTKKYVLNKQ